MSTQLVLKDCGKHHGLTPGPCAKCVYFHEFHARPEIRAGFQASGTPWLAVLGEKGELPRA